MVRPRIKVRPIVRAIVAPIVIRSSTPTRIPKMSTLRIRLEPKSDVLGRLPSASRMPFLEDAFSRLTGKADRGGLEP